MRRGSAGPDETRLWAQGPGHVAFAIREDDLRAWEQQLESHGVEIEACIDWLTDGRSIYFGDPAGNSLELTTPQIWRIEH